MKSLEVNYLRYYRECRQRLTVGDYMTSEALICSNCQMRSIYKIEGVDGLRKVVRENRKIYRQDLRKRRKKLHKIVKTGNGYG